MFDVTGGHGLVNDVGLIVILLTLLLLASLRFTVARYLGKYGSPTLSAHPCQTLGLAAGGKDWGEVGM